MTSILSDASRNRRVIVVLAAALALVGMATAAARLRGGGDGRPGAALRVVAPEATEVAGTVPPTTVPPTTLPPPPPTRVQPLPTVTTPKAAPVVPTTRRSPAPRPTALAVPRQAPVFAGLGTWVDAFDFDPAHTGGHPTVGPADVDRMAAAGVQTLYLQAARSEDPAAPGDLLAPDLLAPFLQRAHALGLKVVAWYLPHLADVGDDLRHLQAVLAFAPGGQQFDAVGVDIEWRASVADASMRSAHLVDLSQRLRATAGGRPLGAIVLPPVVTDVINTAFWPGFPWHGIASSYDAWLPMGYWTNRSADSPYRDAYRYTADNVRMVRENLGDAGAPVHAIGGIGSDATAADYEGFRAACSDLGTIGRSVYDWATTSSSAWPVLRR